MPIDPHEILIIYEYVFAYKKKPLGIENDKNIFIHFLNLKLDSVMFFSKVLLRLLHQVVYIWVLWG